MKKLIRLAALLAVLAAVAWLVKDRLIPAPEPVGEPPPFRPPPPPPPSAAGATTPDRAAAVPAGDDLTQLSGIGRVRAEQLAELGVTTFAALAEADAAALAADLTGASQGQIASWIGQAQERA